MGLDIYDTAGTGVFDTANQQIKDTNNIFGMLTTGFWIPEYWAHGYWVDDYWHDALVVKRLSFMQRNRRIYLENMITQEEPRWQ